jgi:predicted pyridoxine 5'-phosphate oxidase superfamily flavin-nucleotide-binding protein
MSGKGTYHPGELTAQEKAGTRGVAAELSVGMRDSLNFSADHDAFLAAQSFAVVTSIEQASDHIWVTPLFATAGDLNAVSENEISISGNCIPKEDMLRTVQSGSPLSLLGIDLDRRIRHRINGIVKCTADEKELKLHFEVKEYSPNCPKYINRRKIVCDVNAAPINAGAKRQQRTALSDSDRQFIQSMDTLWIGTYAPGVGADTNHRGGKPGFIRVTSPTTIEWPEYRGNGMFFTSGNLEVYQQTGVTFVDFDSGSVIQLTGRAEVDWQHDGSYEGATRVIQFEIEKLIRTDHVTSHRWERLDYSPYNPAIAGADSTATVGDFPTTVTLAKIVEETEDVKTFRFIATRQIVFLPGQYATFEFKNVPGGSASEIRTWTLSETPNSINGDSTLDITVKRVPGDIY